MYVGAVMAYNNRRIQAFHHASDNNGEKICNLCVHFIHILATQLWSTGN